MVIGIKRMDETALEQYVSREEEIEHNPRKLHLWNQWGYFS